MLTARGGRPAGAELRKAALVLACAAGLAASASGCAAAGSSSAAGQASPSAARTPAPGTATGSAAPSVRPTAAPGCAQALNAVSRYGPAVVRDSTGARQFLGRAEAELIVLALDAAADAAGHSADRQPIDSLARQYTKLRDGWSGTRASYLEAILAGTGRLQSVCGS